MKHFAPFTLSTTLALLASPVLADTTYGAFTLKGYAQIESEHTGDMTLSLARANFDMSVDGAALGLGLPLGFTLGYDGYRLSYLSHSEQSSGIYGAITYSGSFGKISVGVPRPVLDDFLSFPMIGGTHQLEVNAGTIFDSMSYMSIMYRMAETDGGAPVGLRYDGSFGKLTVAASYNSVSEADIDALDVAVKYQLTPAIAVTGMAEHLRAGGDSGTSYYVGVEGSMDRLKGGLSYGRRDLGKPFDTTQAFVSYSPIDRLDLTVSAATMTVSGNTYKRYGFSANYSFYKGAYVEAGYVKDDLYLSDSLWNLALGWKF